MNKHTKQFLDQMADPIYRQQIRKKLLQAQQEIAEQLKQLDELEAILAKPEKVIQVV